VTRELLTFDMFSDKIGEIFTIEESGIPPLEIILSEAAPIKNYANAARAPFSLIFTSRGIGVLPQRMYALRHATLGLQSIFLVPVGNEGEIVMYQAVFN
jgi:hypothetical protein